MISNHKPEERKLNSIFDKQIAPVAETEIVKLQIYYRTRIFKALSVLNFLSNYYKKSNIQFVTPANQTYTFDDFIIVHKM